MDKAFILETKIDKLDIHKITRIHLFIKMVQKDIDGEFSDKEMKILSELYVFGGTENKLDLDKFSELCFQKELSKEGSTNSIRNVLSKARKFNIINRKQSNKWVINKSYILPLDSPNVLFKYLLTNIDAKNK